jgi:hypothetical protein
MLYLIGRMFEYIRQSNNHQEGLLLVKVHGSCGPMRKLNEPLGAKGPPLVGEEVRKKDFGT